MNPQYLTVHESGVTPPEELAVATHHRAHKAQETTRTPT